MARLFEVRQNGKFGFIDEAGKVIVEPQFTTAFFGDSHGHGISQTNKLRVLNSDGSVNGELPAIESAGRFNNGYLYVERNDKIAFVDEHAHLVTEFEFDSAFDPVDGRAVVKLNELYGIVTFGIGLTTSPSFLYITQFQQKSDFTSAVDSEGRYQLIDHNGNLVSDLSFASTRVANEGLIPVQAKEGALWGWVNRSGETIVDGRFDSVGRMFSQGTIPVKVNDRWGVADRNGEIVMEAKFSSVGDLRDSRRLFYVGANRPDVLVGGKYGYLDQANEVAIEPQYDSAFDFKYGFARVSVGQRKSARIGWINRSGKYIWNPTN